jgi:anaerobic magnesium-protoporphyrin IX monomethyl ester cyclase
VGEFDLAIGDRTVFLGLTSTTASYRSALALADAARKALPEVVIIMGGHHVSADAETVLRSHAQLVDVVVIGEGERALAEVIRMYPLVDSVVGVAVMRGGLFLKTGSAPLLEQDELDDLSPFHGEKGVIGIPGKLGHVTYVSARGCPLKCAFCAVSNERIRARSVERVRSDILRLINLGYKRIAIEDNFFAHSPRRTREMCETLAEIKRAHPGFSWDCQTRVEAVARPETLRLLEQAGCEAAFIGVESVVHAQLYYLNKTADPDRYLRTLSEVVVPSMLKTSIDCYINLQFGLPRETARDYEITTDYLRSLGRLALTRRRKITVFPQLHVVYPGTPHFRQGVAEKAFPGDVFESFTEWEASAKPIRHWLGEHFAHGTGGIPVGILESEQLARREYVVETGAVARISTALRRISRLPGLEVFQYGEELV